MYKKSKVLRLGENLQSFEKMRFLLVLFGAVFSNFSVEKEEASGLINTFLILRNYGFLRVFVEKAAMGIRS